MPTRPPAAPPDQTTDQIAATLEAFLALHPDAALLEDGKVLFDLRTARYTLSTEHNRCSLHLWSEDRNLVRRISSTTERKGTLRLTSLKFGQSKPQTLELVADKDRRTPSTREATRTRYLRLLERTLLRHFPESKPEAFRTAMDLEKSFGPAYARGSLVHGQHAWAVIAVNDEESPTTIDGILTLGILWLQHCRESAGGRRLFQGLRLIVPPGRGVLTLSRIAWLNHHAAQWQLWEFDQAADTLELSDPADQGNLTTRLLHAPDLAAAAERFANSAAQVLALVPPQARLLVEQRHRSPGELAFLLHGLEFARARIGYAGESFNRVVELTFGTGANETPLTPESEPHLRHLVERLFARRIPGGDPRDPLFRIQPERWLESVLRPRLDALDHHLEPAPVYSQVPAIAAGDRGMIDLLGVTTKGRLAVLELKAEEDLHLALQGLDYWIRVRWHHRQNPPDAPASSSGVGDFQRHGYFPGRALSPDDPRLYLVAPALRIHPATEIVLRFLSPQVNWTLAALDERWRQQIKVVWRKSHSPA